MSVTLFGIGLSAVLACASFVAYWYGWRIAKAVFSSATMITLGAVIIYTLGLPKMVSSIIVAAISCSVALSGSCSPTQTACRRPTSAS